MKQLRLYEDKLPNFEKTGVNPKNVEEWRKLILKKNPWLGTDLERTDDGKGRSKTDGVGI
jgi:hypothetical protein